MESAISFGVEKGHNQAIELEGKYMAQQVLWAEISKRFRIYFGGGYSDHVLLETVESA